MNNNGSNKAEHFLTAVDEYTSGQIILKLGSIETREDNPGRIQVDKTHYILPPHMIYHSCEPNSYIDWDHMTLNALRKIPKGETITYHYGTSEFDYKIGAFKCDCRSSNCVGFFSGFCNMAPSQQLRITDHISDYIRSMSR